MPSIADSDKLKGGLFEAYEKLFAGMREVPIKYLEVGVASGGSLVWARDFFAQGSEIYGLDRTLPPRIDGVTMRRVDQGSIGAMRRFAKEFGPFDIIIDDASHIAKLTSNTFKCFYPALNQNGYYIIEDWAAGYLPQYQGLHTLVLDLVNEHGGCIYMRPDAGGCFAIIGETQC